MREISDRFVPLRGRFLADLSLNEGFFIIDYSVLVCLFHTFYAIYGLQ